MNKREWELIFYYGREWECFYVLLWKGDGNGNTVMGMEGNRIEQSFPHISTVLVNKNVK